MIVSNQLNNLMPTLNLLLSVPCIVHKECDHNAWRLIHGRKYADLSDEEKATLGCDICSGDEPKIKTALIKHGSWTCGCGVIHKLINGNVSPSLVIMQTKRFEPKE